MKVFALFLGNENYSPNIQYGGFIQNPNIQWFSLNVAPDIILEEEPSSHDSFSYLSWK